MSWVTDQPTGLFTLSGTTGRLPVNSNLCGEEDVALVLHTSGTTSRPKIVPLRHRNICTSALNICKTLELTPSDLCLNVMPLFHIHGLIGATLASIAAGAGIVCTPGFYALDFFQWMEEFRPTWYTAVPTMHQAILSRAASHTKIIRKNPLRFIRSSSSALSTQTLMQLETAFGAPVIEAYGMTEASHQMATSPLPPATRKPGSVGVAAGIEIAIMDEAGNLVPSVGTGEIVIRGASVMSGYENNQSANESAFTDGWFRTGDQGILDSDNYLFITGRLKEIINRGGEKISPREVDEVLLEHPAVAQAVTFAVPHPELGEEVAAAIVLRENALVTEAELRSHAAQRLVYFKVPRQVLLLDEIPKGATGKLQRIGLAEKLGVTALARTPVERQADYVSPRTQLEVILAKLWSEILEVPRVGVKDHFFYLGGDSMLATRLISKLREAVQVELPLASVFETPTLGDMASELEYLIIEKFESSADRR
jgi:acyl-CoA synthetase (AMP-forming)/AMP-acid ligase II/acyl carrier protein